MRRAKSRTSSPGRSSLGEDDFCSLPKELQTKYLDMFKYPEKFTAIGGKLVITQDKPRAAPARQEAER